MCWFGWMTIPCRRHYAEKAEIFFLEQNFLFFHHLTQFFLMLRRCCGKQDDDEGGAQSSARKKRKNGNFMASSLYAEHRRAEVVKSYVNVISSSGDVKYVLLILLSRNRLSRTPPSRASHTTARLRFFRCFFLMNRF